MSFEKNMPGIMFRSIWLMLFILAFTPAVKAGPPKPPAWLCGHESLLPSITEAEVVVVEKTLRFHSFTPASRQAANVREAYSEAAKLGERAELALLWLYALSEPKGDNISNRLRSLSLQELQSDPVIDTWLIPLLRYRVQWLEGNLRDHPPEENDLGKKMPGI